MFLLLKGKVLYEKSFGYADRNSGVKSTIDTRYCAASALNKPITAVAILQLVERNMLRLEEPLETFFSEYKDSGINVGHLLNHTSRIPNLLMLLFGCGDVIFTAADINRFDTALHNGTLLHKESVQQMINPTYQGKFVTVGYACMIKQLFDCDSICHGGTHPSG